MNSKLKINLTLNEWETALLDKAVETALPPGYMGSLKGDRRRVLRLALWGFLRSVIHSGRRMDMPVMCEFRAETEAEFQARVNRQLPPAKCDFIVGNPMN